MENILHYKYEFRNIRADEIEQAVAIEQICFPPNEAGFLNGIATDESRFRDEFFTDVNLNNHYGCNVMLLGLDVLPEHRGQGLATEIVAQYAERERNNERRKLILTCLEGKVEMYKKLGFEDKGIANSSWGGEEWHEMVLRL